MHRLRRHIVPLLLMLPVIFICGKLLLTPVNCYPMPLQAGGWVELGKVVDYDFGWPWRFRHATYDHSTAGATKVSVEYFSIAALLGDLAVFSIVLVAYWLLIRMLRKRSTDWRQFSLRGLLVLVALVAVACGWWTNNIRQLNWEERIERQLGDEVSAYREFRAPLWVRRFVNRSFCEKYFYRITNLRFDVSLSEAKTVTLPASLREAIPQLTHLRTLTISGTIGSLEESHPRLRIPDTSALWSIEAIYFDGTADDETVADLARLPNLKSLEFVQCPISNAAMDNIAQCKTLERLSIFRVGFDGKDVTRVPVIDRLLDLEVDGMKINSAVLDSIMQLKSLRRLRLSGQGLTDSMARRLVELPKLEELVVIFPSEISAETKRFLEERIDNVKLGVDWD